MIMHRTFIARYAYAFQRFHLAIKVTLTSSNVHASQRTCNAFFLQTNLVELKKRRIVMADYSKSNQKKEFNLFRYVYGECFLNSLEVTRTSMVVENWKFYSWRNILNWLQNNNYISCLSIDNYDSKNKRVNFIFNHSEVMYPQYLRYLQRLVNSRTVKIPA